MNKKALKILPFIVVGLLVQTNPARADGSILDTLGKAYQSASDAVHKQINHWYGEDGSDDSQDGSQDGSDPTAPPAPSTTPVVTPAPVAVPTGTELSQCKKFLDIVYDPTSVVGSQKIATVYLNGVLDFTLTDLDAKISDDEIAQRNICVELALDAGADPNSNGEYSSANEPSGFIMDLPVPLARAVNDNDEPAVKALLDHKANPNVADTSMGKAIPLLRSAVTNASQDIAVDLINAGADVTVPFLLWSAAGNAADKVVAQLLLNKQIPVNQINKFTDYADDEGETALDPSERGVYALKAYQKKFSAYSSATLQQKIEAANRILYYIYPLKPQLKFPAAGSKPAVDPDEFISDLLAHQLNVSNALKAAGWTCKEDNCGIVDLN